MPTINLDLRDLERAYRKHAAQIPFAASQAINDTAFKMRGDLIEQAQSDLTFRKPARAALGIGVNKSSKRDLSAEVGSQRGWLQHQIQEGVTKPVSGITFKGRQYLLIPSKDARTARGKLKKLKDGVAFVVKSRKTGELTLMVRQGNRNNIRPIGALVPAAKYADDFKWEDQSHETFQRDFNRIFAAKMDRAIATAR